MIPVLDAVEIILGAVGPMPPEKVSILEAHGRVLAEEVTAPRDLPPHDNSAMDGYAVRHADLRPGVVLRVVEAIPAGADPSRGLEPGQAAKIMTGAPIPAGADTVVQVEDTREADGGVEIVSVPAAGANIRPQGEDVRQGTLVLPRGTRVRAAEVGMMASLGRAFVLVHQRPRVAVLATGDEIVDLDSPAQGAKIINSNSYGVAAQVAEAGGVPVVLGIGRDDPEGLLEMFERAATCDAVITTGGVSMGDYDFVRPVLARAGVAVQFWKVAMKPGKPVVFGMKGRVPVFGLPGNPVSAMVAFEQFVRPALRKMLGHRELFRPVVEAVLGEEAGAVRTKAGRTDFVRCRVERGPEGFRVVRVKKQGSGILSTLVQANGLLVIPAESTGAEPGERVRVQIYDPGILDQAEPGIGP
ncbi:molybdopterin molybdotransferase MoeA [Deferrisoma camini]|uniref:molybdopterin molybdotransferase MoeA n=1 Tax=Deferrisoma camini TaxID=1035120 RepID=UPI00046D7BA2|nr:gephyrin-like molybdotransferase Glp [Deferrisoma camini]